MIVYRLKMKLRSDTTFGRGDGVAGWVDREVEHDRHGFPYLRGRTLKGLLSEECDNAVSLLENRREHWQQVAGKLFGKSGSTVDTIAIMKVGDACLPEDLRKAVARQLEEKNPLLNRVQILESLTTVRRQTAIDTVTGTPDKNSLRSERVIIRDLEFTADLRFETQPDDDILALLLIGTLALRRVGSGRNRGRGRVSCSLWNSAGQELASDYLDRFFSSGEDSNP